MTYVLVAVLSAIGAILLAIWSPRLLKNRFGNLSVSDKIGISSIALNIALFVFTAISIKIAMDTYRDAQSSGNEQQRVLESSRAALEKLTEAAGKQLAIIADQNQREVKRLSQHPKIELFLNGVPLDKIKNLNVNVEFLRKIALMVWNKGDAALVSPFMEITTSTSSAKVRPLGGGEYRDDPSRIEFNGANSFPRLEAGASSVGYTTTFAVDLPANLNDVVLSFGVGGSDFKPIVQKLTLHVVRQ